jgi:hypothetical protein
MKTQFLKHVSAVLFLTSLAACGDAFDPASRVSSFRVLAQQMDAPYAAPGETVHVSSLVYDTAGRAVSWAWATCLNPHSSAVTGCLDKVAEDSKNGQFSFLALGPNVDAVDVQIPADALSALPAEARSTAALGVLSVACPGTLALGAGSTGFPFRCTDPETQRELGLDEFVVGVKRVIVRETDKNQNPVIDRITLDGKEWPPDQVPELRACDESGNDLALCPEELQHRVSAVLTSASFEHGTTEYSEGFEEQLVVQYFATEGIFESDSRIADSPENKWVAREQSKGLTITFWFVARDNRGGVVWTTREAQVP